MKRLLMLLVLLAIGSWLCSTSSSAAPPSPKTVTTTVTVGVATGAGPGCSVSGLLKGTYTVSMNPDGTAKVKVALKPIDVGGCAPVKGTVTATMTVPVGQAASVYGSLSFHTQGCDFSGSDATSIFTVNPDGTVHVGYLNLQVYCLTQYPPA